VPDRRAAGRVPLVAASYLVVRRDDEVLLQLRRGTGYMDGFWATLAGHVECGESAVDAAVREAREEAGIDVDPCDVRPVTALHRYEVGGPPVEQRCDFIFETRVWRGEPSIREPHRTAAMEWFRLGLLPQPVVPHERLVLEALLRGEVPAITVVRTVAGPVRQA
jgi:8-oxo-dGTP diphosphatase